MIEEAPQQGGHHRPSADLLPNNEGRRLIDIPLVHRRQLCPEGGRQTQPGQSPDMEEREGLEQARLRRRRDAGKTELYRTVQFGVPNVRGMVAVGSDGTLRESGSPRGVHDRGLFVGLYSYIRSPCPEIQRGNLVPPPNHPPPLPVSTTPPARPASTP